MARKNGENLEDVKPEEKKPTRRTPAKKKAAPKLKDVTVSVSSGGSVGLVGFGNLKSDFKVFQSRTYDVTGMTDAEVDEFYHEKYVELRRDADERAQIEFDSLIEDSALFDADGTYIGSNK